MPFTEHSLPPERDYQESLCPAVMDAPSIDEPDFANIDIDGGCIGEAFARLDEECPDQNVQLEKRGLTSHLSTSQQWSKKEEYQGNFWSKQTVFKNSIAAKLRSIGRHDLADDLEHCHSEVTYAKCNGCGSVSKFMNRCDRFFCPECQPKLSRERKESVEWWTKEIGQPKHVVLTVRNVGRLTKKFVKAVKKMFGRLRRSKFAANWKGGFYSLEITNEGKGWHLHIHALIDCRYIDERELSIAWGKATRMLGYIVKVKDCRQKSYLQEVTKYAVKGNDLAKWKPEQILEFITAFEGVRQFGVFGSLYSKRTEFAEWLEAIRGKQAICKCGCNNVHFFSENEWEALDIKLSEQISAVPKVRCDNTMEFGFVRNIDLLTSMK